MKTSNLPGKFKDSVGSLGGQESLTEYIDLKTAKNALYESDKLLDQLSHELINSQVNRHRSSNYYDVARFSFESSVKKNDVFTDEERKGTIRQLLEEFDLNFEVGIAKSYAYSDYHPFRLKELLDRQIDRTFKIAKDMGKTDQELDEIKKAIIDSLESPALNKCCGTDKYDTYYSDSLNTLYYKYKDLAKGYMDRIEDRKSAFESGSVSAGHNVTQKGFHKSSGYSSSLGRPLTRPQDAGKNEPSEPS